MPGSYRGIILALGLILAGHHPDAEAQPKQDSAQERSADALQNIAARYDEHTKRADGSRETEQCDQGDDKRYSDLCAQWKAADAAADSAWWAAVGSFASAISALLVLVALYLAFRSNWIARDTAKRQLRAYLTFDSIEGEVYGSDWHFKLAWKNAGQTPAREVWTSVQWREVGRPIHPDFAFPEKPATPGDGRAVVGPSQLIYATADEPITLDVKRRVAAKETFVYVWGFVDYRDAFGTQRRTEFASRMVATIAKETERDLMVDVRWTVIDRHNGMDEDCAKYGTK